MAESAVTFDWTFLQAIEPRINIPTQAQQFRLFNSIKEYGVRVVPLYFYRKRNNGEWVHIETRPGKRQICGAQLGHLTAARATALIHMETHDTGGVVTACGRGGCSGSNRIDAYGVSIWPKWMMSAVQRRCNGTRNDRRTRRSLRPQQVDKSNLYSLEMPIGLVGVGYSRPVSELRIVQLGITSTAVQQVIVGSGLDDHAVIDHKDTIGANDGVEPMRDDKVVRPSRSR